MLHCKFSGDYNSEIVFKNGQYLTKSYVEHLGFTFFGHPVALLNGRLSPCLVACNFFHLSTHRN